MGYYVINNLIKERINKMSNETKKQTIDSIKSVESMKAVKVAYDLTAETMTSISAIAKLVKNNTDNLNLLATKVLELEKKLEAYEQRKN